MPPSIVNHQHHFFLQLKKKYIVFKLYHLVRIPYTSSLCGKIDMKLTKGVTMKLGELEEICHAAIFGKLGNGKLS